MRIILHNQKNRRTFAVQEFSLSDTLSEIINPSFLDMRYRLAMLFIAFVCLAAFAQNRPAHNPRESQYIFWGYPDNYLENQARESFQKIDEALRANPPARKENVNRDMALIAMDMLLHDTRNDNSASFHHFINTRLEAMLHDMEQPVKKGVKIYKAYNDGFIIKTKTATIAIDLIPGGKKDHPFIGDSLLFAIAGKCDALFISHAHGDHANLRVAKAFAAAGKTVIVPKGLWTDVDPLIKQLLTENQQVTVPFNELGMTLQILPGHQDDMYNNIYVMQFQNGISVAHTGDQYHVEDLEWIDHIRDKMSIDVLLLNCWVNSLERTVKGFNPRLIITGHENEMEHSIDHREAYWMTMRKYAPLTYPNVLMTWGEHFLYKK